MPDQILRTKVLIVDDNAVTVALLKGLLQRDYVVEAALTGHECQEKIASFVPDIVLLDILIPDIDGYNICQWIRQTMAHAQPIIIGISSQSTLQDKMQAYQSGMDDYVVKPFSDDEVTAKIRVYSKIKAIDKRWRAAQEALSEVLLGTRDCVRAISRLSEGVLDDPVLLDEARDVLGRLKGSGEKIQQLIKSDAYEKTNSHC